MSSKSPFWYSAYQIKTLNNITFHWNNLSNSRYHFLITTKILLQRLYQVTSVNMPHEWLKIHPQHHLECTQRNCDVFSQFKVQGLFIRHILNYTGYNQKLNVNINFSQIINLSTCKIKSERVLQNLQQCCTVITNNLERLWQCHFLSVNC